MLLPVLDVAGDLHGVAFVCLFFATGRLLAFHSCGACRVTSLTFFGLFSCWKLALRLLYGFSTGTGGPML